MPNRDENIMMTKKLFKKIEKIPNLNRWGCLYSSYWVHLALKEKWIESFIVQFSNEKCYIRQNMDFIKGKNNEAASDYHFCLMVGEKIFDTDWEVNYNFSNKKVWKKEIDLMCRSSLENWNWNPSFSVYEIHKIEKRLWIKFEVNMEKIIRNYKNKF